MRVSDLVSPNTPVASPVHSAVNQPTATVQRLLETRDQDFGKPMTGKELMEWVKSL